MSQVPQSTESEQGYCTPDWLYAALNAIFRYVIDLAASADNAHCDVYLDEVINSLLQSWAELLVELGGSGFCNPPFAVIEPWVRKAIEEAAKLPASVPYAITLLVPHNVSAAWFVEGARYAETLIISPRFKYRHPNPEAARAAAAAKGKKWSDSAPQGSMLMCFTRDTVLNPTAPGEPLRIGHLHLPKPGTRSHALPNFDPVVTAGGAPAQE